MLKCDLNSYNNSVFDFLYDLFSKKEDFTTYVCKEYENYEKLLMHNGNTYTNAGDLCSKLVAIAQRLPKCMPPQEVLLFILKQKPLDIIPNISIALIIFSYLQ